MVGLQLKSLGGDFSQFLTQLTDVGMQITTSSSYYGLVDGYAPINELPTIAELSQTQSGQVEYDADLRGQEYQGVAYNEAETSTVRRHRPDAVQRRRNGRDDRRALGQRQPVRRAVWPIRTRPAT